MKNQVIKVLNKEHGKEVIQYWKDKGFDIRDIKGLNNEEDDCSYIYYGIIDDYFREYSLSEVQSINTEIITLPMKNEYPKVMEVSNDEYFKNYKTRVAFMVKCGKFLAWSDAETLEEAEKETFVTTWNYAREIQEKPIELTLQDISDGKGVGVPVHLIRIKE